MAGKKTKRKPRKRRVIASCYFCDEKKNPDYKDHRELRKYVTERAKILGSIDTGICSKHQRLLTISIKRARHLGLLPFSPRTA